MCKETSEVKLHSLSLQKKEKASKTATVVIHLQGSLLKREKEKTQVQNH